MRQEMLRRLDPSLHHRFVFLGELSSAQLRSEIQACRFQVIPSIVENFANTAIDALAAGRLVVYPGNSGLDDVVGNAGLRVWPISPENLANEMSRAWNDYSLAADYGRMGWQRIQTEFNVLNVTRQRLAFYEQIRRDYADLPHPPIYDRLGEMNSQHMACVLNALAMLLHSAAGAPAAVATPGRHVLRHLENLAQRLGRPPVVWLFGAGRYTLRLLAERFLWESHGLSIAGIIDEHPRFAGMTHYLGLPIRSLQQIHADLDAGASVDAVFLSTDTLQDMFWERTASLRSRGIQTHQLDAK
jgi:hypothetical protein